MSITGIITSALLTVNLTAAPVAFKDAEDVLAYLKDHPKDFALIGGGIRHGGDRAVPVASNIKIIHLAAYAAAVRSGKVKPTEPVPLAKWNAYHLPGTDGGAHEAALKRLKPGKNATIDQVVSAMIEESDNAGADLLRDRLGLGKKVPTINGEMLKAFGGCEASADTCIKRYVATGKPVQLTLPSLDKQIAWARTVTRVKPSTLHSTLTELTGDKLARKHLEWPMRQPGADPAKLVVGTKGGMLPGVISESMYFVKPGHKPQVFVLSIHRMPGATWLEGLQSYAHQQFIVRMATDPAFLARVSAAVK